MIKFNSTKNWSAKRNLFFFSVFSFLALFLFWPSQTLAFWQELKNAFLSIPYLLVAIVIILCIVITQAFAWFCGFLLDTTTSPTLISLSYTNPDNPVIRTGLNITQSFVNLLLVIALVYTALSIALRINETGAKKMLARLIIVALLVNFSPVFCGLVVDATNIAMYYFLKPLKEGVSGLLTQIGPFIDMVKKTSWDAKFDLTEKLGVLMIGVVMILINVLIAFAFLIYAIVFLVRYIAIWILVILSPLAFAAWVFPTTRPEEHWEFLEWILFPLSMLRGFWNKWLKEFSEWTIVGIPMAFFLYLAMSSFSLMTAAFKQKIEMPGIDSTTSGLLNEVFPYFVVIIFLFLGFTFGLQTGTKSASAIIGYAKERVKKSGKKVAGMADILARRTGSAILGTMGKERLERWATTKLGAPFGQSKAGKIAAAAGWATGFTPAWWAIRRGLGEAGLRMVEAEKQNIQTAEEEYKDTMPERKLAGIRDAMRIGSSKKAVGILRQGIEEGQISGLKKLGLTNAEIIKLGKSALKTHPDEFKKIRDAFPHLAEKMAKGFSDDIQKAAGVRDFNEALENLKKRKEEIETNQKTATGSAKEILEKELKKIEDEIKEVTQDKEIYGTVTAKIIAEIKPKLIPKIDKEAFKTEDAKWAIHKFWTANQVKEAVTELGKPFIEDFSNTAKEAGLDWYKINNFPLAKYLTSSAAQGLGLGPIPEEGKGPFPTPPPPPPEEAPPAPPTPPPPPRGRPGVGGPPTAPPRGRPGVGETTIVTPSEATIGERTLTEE